MTTFNKASPVQDNGYQQFLDQETVPVPGHLREQRSPELGSMRLDVHNYLSSEFHRQEVEHVWLHSWQLACREEDIPEVGDHLTYDVADLSLILVRSSATEIKAFFNSCLHRGRRLVTESGNDSRFRCCYHAWTWNLDGSIRFVPCKEDFEYAGNEAFQLPEALVECWQGFVFVNPDTDSEPLQEFLEVLPEHFRDYELDQCFKALHIQKNIDCNWKAALEAFMESYHVIATHPQLLTFMGDANAQYDILSDHVSRSITLNAVNSPHIDAPSPQHVLEDTLRESGRVFNQDELRVPEGASAREYLAAMNREIFSREHGRDYSQATDSELLDAILYWVFPNIEIWGGYLANIVYRARPLGNNPDRCIFEIMVLQRVPAGQPKPAGVPVHYLRDDERFSDTDELGILGKVFDQDLDNLPHVQQGMKTADRNGRGGLILGDYQEARIAHLHRMLERYIEAGEKAGR